MGVLYHVDCCSYFLEIKSKFKSYSHLITHCWRRHRCHSLLFCWEGSLGISCKSHARRVRVTVVWVGGKAEQRGSVGRDRDIAQCCNFVV